MYHNEAEKACYNLGMELVSVPNEDYQIDLKFAVAAFGLSDHFWTSGNNVDSLNVFQWKGATLPLESFPYSNWGLKNPLTYPDVSHIGVSINSMLWYNWPSTSKYSALCTTDLDIFLLAKYAQRKSVLAVLGQEELPKIENVVLNGLI